MIEQGLWHLLSTTTAITALCKTRIYPVILPTDPTYPALTYQMISVKADPTLDTSGLQRWRIQFDCWSSVYAEASSLRAALTKALNGYQGTLVDGTLLQNVDLVQITDFFADQARIFRCMAEFYLYFDFSN